MECFPQYGLTSRVASESTYQAKMFVPYKGRLKRGKMSTLSDILGFDKKNSRIIVTRKKAFIETTYIVIHSYSDLSNLIRC